MIGFTHAKLFVERPLIDEEVKLYDLGLCISVAELSDSLYQIMGDQSPILVVELPLQSAIL